MTVEVIYFVAVIGLGLISIVIGFLSAPNRHKKPAPVPVVPGNTGDWHISFNYKAEEQIFLSEIGERPMEQKPNWGEDYQLEKQKRDVDAFSEYCRAGLTKILAPEVPDSGRSRIGQ